jgi:hypothetical protein
LILSIDTQSILMAGQKCRVSVSIQPSCGAA